MDKRNAPLLVAVAVLLLPALYVGSYFALVTPWDRVETYADGEEWIVHYRIPGHACWLFFKPIQRLDRMVRPDLWRNPYAPPGDPD